MTVLSPFEIPVDPGTPETFSISLAGVTYQLTLKWNIPAGCWMLDIADDDGDAILGGIPLITGADLLAQFEYLGLNGALLVQTDHDPFQVPGFNDLGANGHLYFLTNPNDQ